MRPKLWLILSAILYALACALPALEFRRNEDGREIWGGFQILAMGWLGVFLGQFTWLANPLLLAAAVYLIYRNRQGTLIFSILAALLSLQTFALFSESVPGDEANVNKLYLRHLREGAFCWFGSIVIIIIGGILCRARSSGTSNCAKESQSGEFVSDAWESGSSN